MYKLRQLLLSSLAGLIISTAVMAESVELNSNHPQEYTVVKGDTLWDISAMFLRDPWRWSDIWYVNDQIANPHLIYPGDVLVLTYVNGKPMLTKKGCPPNKLCPEVKSLPLEDAIPMIPIDAIRPFLTRPSVLNDGEYETLPYVVAFADEHIIGGAGQNIYVRSVEDASEVTFDIIRKGGEYRDHETNELLGIEAIYVGNSKLKSLGDPATLHITSSEQHTTKGDRLVPSSFDSPFRDLYPKVPEADINGAIISVMNGVTQIGQYNIVVLDRGASNGLQVGDVLSILHRGPDIRDTVSDNPREMVKLPDEEAGQLVIFRTFDRVSFGIVMFATRAIHIHDKVVNPE